MVTVFKNMHAAIRQIYKIYGATKLRPGNFHTCQSPLVVTALRFKSGKHDHDDEDDKYNDEYQQLVSQYLSYGADHSCYIIHPYVKWGQNKVRDTDPDRQLEECISLVRTLESWQVHDSMAVPVDTLDKKKVFAKGNFEKLKGIIRDDPRITAVFVNVGSLKIIQKEELERAFQVPVFDRYNIVMLILKKHATSKHAKLQVALAEVGYMLSRLRKGIDSTGTVYDTKKLILQTREKKIKSEIEKLRTHRSQQRLHRSEKDYPIVAVVGYTNAGKTSLIKCLSGDKHLEPQDRFFATLDVTLHAGVLPSNLEVLYVDTVGFISNIPTTLIECFIVTLEDALYADLVLHVEDVSSDNLVHQRNHVIDTLRTLSNKMQQNILQKTITVGNKCDMIKDKSSILDGELLVSAKTGEGLDKLMHEIENALLEVTGRQIVTIRIPIGGNEIRWLYQNATIFDAQVDSTDSQLQKVKVIITPARLQQFKHYYCT